MLEYGRGIGWPAECGNNLFEEAVKRAEIEKSVKSFVDVLFRIADRTDVSPRSRTWKETVDEFVKLTSRGDVILIASPLAESLEWGYYEILEDDRCSRIVEVCIPKNFAQEQGKYLENDIAGMVSKVVTLHFETATDSRRRTSKEVKWNTILKRLVGNKGGTVPKYELEPDPPLDNQNLTA